MTKETLFDLLKQNNISCSQEQLSLLMTFMEYTLSTNEKFNLTAITDREVFVEKMIFDSAIALKDLDLSNKTIIDIGTGAGYPGMVLSILEPKANVYLLDSTAKKIDYLVKFALQNNLEIHGINARAEDFSRTQREFFDYAVARAVAPLNILVEIIAPLLKVNGTFIAMKGSGYEQELNEASKALKKLNVHVDHIYEFELPESKEKRAIIYLVKDKETNKKYPRQYNEIKKQPL